MSNQIEIEELRERIKDKEGQLYRTEKEITSWSRGKSQSHSNAKMSKQFVDASRKEIAELRSELRKLESEKSWVMYMESPVKSGQFSNPRGYINGYGQRCMWRSPCNQEGLNPQKPIVWA